MSHNFSETSEQIISILENNEGIDAEKLGGLIDKIADIFSENSISGKLGMAVFIRMLSLSIYNIERSNYKELLAEISSIVAVDGMAICEDLLKQSIH